MLGDGHSDSNGARITVRDLGAPCERFGFVYLFSSFVLLWI